MPKLYVLSGEDVGRSYSVEGDAAVLGRGKGVDVHVRGGSVSRSHARLERTASGWTLTDLGSSNGIRVEGQRVRAGDLVDGTLFHLGEVELRFRGDVADEPVAAPPELTFEESAAETAFVAPARAPASEAGLELEGDWDESVGAAIEPARSAPAQPARPAAPAPAPGRGAKDVAGKRAQALGSAAARGGAQDTSSGRRILQYNRIENRAGLLGADVGQQTTGMRWLLYALVLALFAGLAWGAFTLASNAKRNAALVEGEE